MTGYENAWQALNISFSKWKQNVWRQPAIFVAHCICDQSAGHSHRFFHFPFPYFFSIFFYYFVVVFSSAFISFYFHFLIMVFYYYYCYFGCKNIYFFCYLYFVDNKKKNVFFSFFLSCSTNLAKFFVRMLCHPTPPMTSAIWRIFAELTRK